MPRFTDIPQFTSFGRYKIDVPWDGLLHHLNRLTGRPFSAPLDLNPDFQRGHVWTQKQQTAFVEYGLRGGQSAMTLLFNCPGWQHDYRGPHVIVDGLQRLTAVTKFLNNDLRVFGSYHKEFEDSLSFSGPRFEWYVNELKTREEVLAWYIQLNSGGVAHTRKEISRVTALLSAERSKK